jgi:hypothetical protein
MGLRAQDRKEPKKGGAIVNEGCSGTSYPFTICACTHGLRNSEMSLLLVLESSMSSAGPELGVEFFFSLFYSQSSCITPEMQLI